MNILFVYYLPSGGVETLNRQRAIALKNRGINCDFLYYQKKRDLVNHHEGRIFITNIDSEIQHIIRDGNYTAIVITSDFQGLSRFRNLGYNGVLIYEIQGLGKEETAKIELPKISSFISKNADAILVSKTPHILSILKTIPDLPPLFVMNNCIDTEHFGYRYEKSGKNPIIAWIGRIEENKNWHEFLQIGHKLIHEYNPNIQLYLFEDPTLSLPQEREKFYKVLKTLNLENNINLLSNIPHEEMPKFFSIVGDSGGFLCSTSITEGFGYAIVEAMSCKCPVLSTKSDGVSNSIIHNLTGKYYNLGNISEAFIEAEELMSNNNLRNHIRTEAVLHVRKEFSMDTYGSEFRKMMSVLTKQS
ncbi:glycosyltransferase family 4 protein [Paucisalibacillus sp. EB02]|uniref:glycosyltransferase family 4 protein n=1 Tax=Paucisalibacillus sp. EB02 TaxID=1347087 RepID=UPI0004B7AB25|nr:glycosyltransferase [Paucisalibacillus sp. EB02]